MVEYNADQVWTGYPANWDRWVGYSYTPDMLNRSSVNDGGTITNYSFSSLNQYTGVGGLNPTYDENFNLKGFNGATYVYGYTSQLISASKGGNSVQFTYDGLGRCVRRVVNGAARIFTYDGWKPMLEWDGAGNWLAQNIYGAGPDEILARYDSIGRALTYKRDKQGNVVALLGNDGSVVEKYRYDAFGQPTVTDNWGNVWAGSIHENRFMFTGREWIKELGIYDYRNRFYHPGLGRFLQGDPLGLQTEGVKLTAGEKALFFGGQAPEAFSSSEMNLYRYSSDDPVDNSDPFGLEMRGEDVPFQFVPSVPGEYGHTAFDVKAVVGYFPTEGGFSLRTTRLDVTILSRQVATEVKVAGERRARPRTDEAIAATVKHEGIHGTDAKTFHDANQNRLFPGVFKSPSEAKKAASEAGKQLQREFKESQKHTPPEKWNDIQRKESFR